MRVHEFNEKDNVHVLPIVLFCQLFPRAVSYCTVSCFGFGSYLKLCL